MKAARRKVLHPDFLGAHRYTTARGGIGRSALRSGRCWTRATGTQQPAGGGLRCRSGPCRATVHWTVCTLRTAVACLRQSKWGATRTRRCAGHTYPVRYCHGS